MLQSASQAQIWHKWLPQLVVSTQYFTDTPESHRSVPLVPSWYLYPFKTSRFTDENHVQIFYLITRPAYVQNSKRTSWKHHFSTKYIHIHVHPTFVYSIFACLSRRRRSTSLLSRRLFLGIRIRLSSWLEIGWFFRWTIPLSSNWRMRFV